MKSVLKYSLNIILIGLFLAFGVVLRAYYLHNTQGLTISELSVYSELFDVKNTGIWHNIMHGEPLFSLYALIISCWKTFVSSGTYGLRLLSVAFGIITCFISYFSKDKFQGFLCLILFSLNSFLINYSQEVGMYSLLGLFAVLNTVSLLKIKNNDKGYFLWIVSVIGLLLTSLFSAIFVLFEIVVYLVYQRNKKFIVSFISSIIILCPYFVYIGINFKKYLDYYFDVNYDYANSYAFLQNVLTPKLIELNLDNVSRYFASLLFDINFYTLVFVFVPVLISLYFILKSFFEDKFNFILFLIGFLYVIARVFLQVLFGIQFSVGEYITIAPLIIILLVSGIDRNLISYILVGILILTNLSYLVTQENSAFRNNRFGVLAVSDIINMSIKDGDVVVTWVELNDFGKYLNKKVKIINMYDDYIKNAEERIVNKDKLKTMSKHARKDFYRQHFLTKIYSNDIVSKTNVLMGCANEGNKIYLVYPQMYDVDFYSFLDIVSKDFLYYTYSEDDLFYMQSISQINRILADFYINKTVKDKIVVMIYKK